MKNNFFRWLGHMISLPIITPIVMIKRNQINRKAERYLSAPEDYDKLRRYEEAYSVCKKALFVLNTDIEIRGAEHLVKRPMFFVPNHKSNLDPLLLIVKLWEMKGFPYFNIVAKKELIENKWAKGVAQFIDSIFIDRENLRDAVRVVNEETERLRENSVVCFPEGTRVSGDEFAPFKPAALEPAYRTLAPIVPVVIYGTDGCLVEGEKKRLRYKKIIIEFMDPIKHTSYGKESKEYFTEKLQKRMQEQYNKLKKEVEGGNDGRDDK